MRIALILILALFAGTAFAQAPVIDSMLIDESKSILSIYGDFGTTQGKVWCDSVELPVLSWSASLVTATIPDTGKGSAGGVVVEDISGVSETRFITLWNGTVYVYREESYSVQGHGLQYICRLDLAKFLLSKKNSIQLTLSNTSTYNNYYGWSTEFHPDYGYNVSMVLNDTVQVQNDSVNYRRGFSANVVLSINGSDFHVHLQNIKGLIGTRTGSKPPNGPYSENYEVNINAYEFTVPIDSTYQIKTDTVYEGDIVYDGYRKTTQITGTQSFLPYKTIFLNYNPSIIAPNNNRTNLGTDDVLLKWNPLKYMDAYHIQLSKDSLINGQRAGQAQQGVTYIIDTIVSSLDFTLPPLEKNTKYYWRVCGVNSEGESRWSEVWSFTTGASTDVKKERAKSISLVCYPNPAMNELTIVTTEPTRLLLYDVTGKIIKSEQVTLSQTKWDVSLLPNGTYILGTSHGEMQVVQIVK